MSEELQLIVVEQIKPLELFTAPDRLKTFLSEIDKKVMSIVADMTTAKGRKDIASIAYKVARTKTTLDDLGKAEVAKLKDLPKKIDAGRKEAREFLDALAERYRKPLTDWEAEEKSRIEAEELAREIDRCHGEALEMEAFFERERQVAKKEAEFARIEAERKAQEEADRKERERKAEIERVRIAEEKKAANKKHREKVKKEACRFIQGVYGTTQEQAEGIFDVIAAGDVPHIKIEW